MDGEYLVCVFLLCERFGVLKMFCVLKFSGARVEVLNIVFRIFRLFFVCIVNALFL